jgi:hypothetical protein
MNWVAANEFKIRLEMGRYRLTGASTFLSLSGDPGVVLGPGVGTLS